MFLCAADGEADKNVLRHNAYGWFDFEGVQKLSEFVPLLLDYTPLLVMPLELGSDCDHKILGKRADELGGL